nr:hypothetical protein [Tenacibaculum agarivorans]
MAESIEDSLSIIDQTTVEKPDFNNKRNLTEKIEKESMKFIKELKDILE